VSDIWDIQAGENLKAEGMALVQKPVAEQWKSDALAALRQVAGRMEFLTADDVIELVGDPPLPADPRAWGPIISHGCRVGWIEAHGLTKSRRSSCHATPRRVYRSLVYRGAP